MSLADEIQRDMQRLSQLKSKVIPKLTGTLHKGACGRVGVVGGSELYTGAPYFAAVSALRTGADIAYIQTHTQAAQAIKTYSPELIVLPGLESLCGRDDPELKRQLTRMHALVVGPGLSRNEDLLRSALKIIQEAQAQSVALILDAEGLLLLQRHPELFQSYPMTVLTPNIREFQALCQAFDIPIADKVTEAAETLARRLGNLTLVVKGQEDVITNGHSTLLCHSKMSSRRAGGQGDLLAGSLAAFLGWANLKKTGELVGGPQTALDCAWGACTLIKTVSRRAYQAHHRATAVPDMIPLISKAFFDIFDCHEVL